MQYTLYVLRCTQSGNVRLGVTTELRECVERLREDCHSSAIMNPELLHIEHHDTHDQAHRRIQDIARTWHKRSGEFSFSAVNPLAVHSVRAALISMH